MKILADYVHLLHEPLAAGGIAAAVVSAGIAAWSVARAPSRDASKLGPRGLKRQRAVQAGGWFALAEPLLRWLGARLSGLLPASLYATLDMRLVRAGDWLGISPEEYVVLFFAGCAGGAAVGRLLDGGSETPVLPILLAVLGAAFVQGRLDREIQRRLREITHGLPYVIDLLALGMTAGLDFPGAVKHVVDRSSVATDALNEELERILQELALGHTRRHALMQLATRTRVPSAVEFANAVVQAEERGSPLVEVLTIQAQVARQKRTAQAEEAAAKAATAMSLPLALLAASTLVLLIVPMLLNVVESFRRFV